MKMLKPPTPLDTGEDIVVFLAGSIEQGTAERWQDALAERFSGVDGITFLNPYRDQWNKDLKQSINEPEFKLQVDWELDGLEMADVVIVYFDPKTKSPISLLELGLHAASGKCLVCCPDGFWRKGNVEIICDRYDIPLFNKLSDLENYMRESLNGVL